MKIVYFTHSLRSCWNHGNAHFLRGVLRALTNTGHEVVAGEKRDSWSAANLLADHGESGFSPFFDTYPELRPYIYTDNMEVEALCDGADLVLVHEWSDFGLVAALGKLRRHSRFTLLFHDTHHRAVSDPASIAYDLSSYDGVLAFGESLARVYRGWGWGDRVWVWHEAADLEVFHPPAIARERRGLVWIGNWGDGERTAELQTYLFEPASLAHLKLEVYGVRYPPESLAMLDRFGATYHGWLANPRAPDVFAGRLATVHVPRRFYADMLPGIPTIRVFEALACGIPLVCAPWEDSEGLFRPGDYLTARDGDQMLAQLRRLRDDPGLRSALAAQGLDSVRSRHSCAQRAAELMAIVAGLRAPVERIA